MLIRQSTLNFQPPEKFPALFILAGQECLMSTMQADVIKLAWKKKCQDEVAISVITVQSASDWQGVVEDANSYNLFAEYSLLDVRFDKRTMEIASKKIMEMYLKAANPRCLILLRAPDLPLKQLQFFTSHEAVQVVYSSRPDKRTILQWMADSLGAFKYDAGILPMIFQYTEGNLLASQQLLDKLALLKKPGEFISPEEVSEQLINQCIFPLFDLTEACLTGHSSKALQLLRLAQHDKTEPVLVLWHLSQEIRLLLNLFTVMRQGMAFREAASKLNIWTNKISLYQSAMKKYDESLLTSLHQACLKIDHKIKTGQNYQLWSFFECIAITLCTGKRIGYFG